MIHSFDLLNFCLKFPEIPKTLKVEIDEDSDYHARATAYCENPPIIVIHKKYLYKDEGWTEPNDFVVKHALEFILIHEMSHLIDNCIHGHNSEFNAISNKLHKYRINNKIELKRI